MRSLHSHNLFCLLPIASPSSCCCFWPASRRKSRFASARCERTKKQIQTIEIGLQLVGSLVYAAIYYGRFVQLSARRELDYSPWPAIATIAGRYDAHYLRLLATLFFHSIQKQLLTDGSAYVMTFTQQLSFKDQGEFSRAAFFSLAKPKSLLQPSTTRSSASARW